MSDSHHLCGGVPSLGEVDHTSHLSENIGALYCSEECSDVTLLIEGQRIPSHKVVLAARSRYFCALLYNGLRESQLDEVELKETPLVPFKILLKYIYTGRITLASLKEELVLEVLGLAHQYGFAELEASVCEHLSAALSIRNVCVVYDLAALFRLASLAAVCAAFVDRHALDVLHHESFLALSPSALKEMLSRDSFCAPEVDIFRAVCEWARHNPRADVQDVLPAVRLPLMALPDLLNVVRPTHLVSPDTLLDAIKARTESRDTDLKYRGYLMAEENVATAKAGAQVLVGELPSALLDGDVHSYDLERGFTRHPIDDNAGGGILLMLGRPCIINHVRMLLWDRDSRSYSYYIEVSVDQKDWVRVIDHTKYLCRSWQQLYFKPRVVRYIRIVGTHNTVNRVFHAVSFECFFTERAFRVERGLLCPSTNVATVGGSATVPEGVSRSRNALINGDTENYDWDSGYTCHQLGSGAIVVQLPQPYLIDSMRMLLWDCDQRSYSYYVEVSTDQTQWHIVADKRKEACRAWQLITFPARPVVFVKIVGTHNTENEVFHCVHFECPAQIATSPHSSSSTSSSKSSLNGDENSALE